MARFQDECEKDLTLNQLIVMILEKIIMTEEAKVPVISVISDWKIYFEKGYHHGVYILLYFNKDDVVDSK